MRLWISRWYWPLALVLFYSVILAVFQPKNQSWESYMYGAAGDGYFDIAAFFSQFSPHSAPLPNIADYHPNHPLGHLVTAIIRKITGLHTLQIMKGLNGIFAVLFIPVCFFTCQLFVKKPLYAAIGTGFFIFTHTFWLLALSCEAFMPAITCVTAATYFLLKYLIQEKLHCKTLSISGIFYFLAGAFHLSTFLWIIPATFSVIIHKKAREKTAHWLTTLSVIALGYILFYVILMVYMLNISSVKEFFETCFIYNRLSTASFPILFWIQMALESIGHTIVTTPSSWSLLGGLVVLSGILCSSLIFFTKKLKNVHFLFFFVWFITYLILSEIIRGRPDAVHLWCVILLPLPICISFTIEFFSHKKPAFKYFIYLITFIIPCINFSFAILPKFLMIKKDVVYIENPDREKQTPIVFVMSNSRVSMADLWTLGTEYGFKNITIFLPQASKYFQENFLKFIKGKKNILLFSDDTTGIFDKYLVYYKIKTFTLHSRQGMVQKNWLHESMNSPWYKQESFKKNLTVYYLE